MPGKILHSIANLCVLVVAVFVSSRSQLALAADLIDPPVFASRNGELSLLMIAAERSGVDAGDGKTYKAWTYEICRRPTGRAPNACPSGTGESPPGGVRLQLQRGDNLRIRLVNKLPPVPNAKHVVDNPELAGNPTNLHTHGMLVEPHRAEGDWDTYGDYVFLEIRQPANPTIMPVATAGALPVPVDSAVHAAHAGHHTHPDMDRIDGAAEYRIHIGDQHPAGLFWFHPHLHGLSLNQVTSGMAGLITVGRTHDICRDADCRRAIDRGGIHELVLKDTQIEASGVLLNQQDPAFCAGAPATGAAEWAGMCPG